MITSIDRLANCGIFLDFLNAPETPRFAQFNLVYGWNGTGKTTLTRLLARATRALPLDEFPSAKYSITLNDGTSITHTRPPSIPINIHVFNPQYVVDNIDWNNIVRSILLVSEEKIAEMATLKAKKGELESLGRQISTAEGQIAKDSAALDGFLSDCARQIKARFQVLDTADRYYLNYNKTKLESFVQDKTQVLMSGRGVLSDEEVARITQTAKPTLRDPISLSARIVDPAKLSDAHEKLTAMLKACPVQSSIDRLSKNADIQAWVETGLSLHDKHGSNACEYCGNSVSPDRVAMLRKHFSTEYSEFKAGMIEAQDWLASLVQQSPAIPPKESLFEEMQDAYERHRMEVHNATEDVSSLIETWRSTLALKQANPFNDSLTIPPFSSEPVDSLNKAWSSLQTIVDAHNEKSANFTTETQKAKSSLELHYASQEFSAFQYFSKKDALGVAKEALTASRASADVLTREVQSFEASLSNETLGADAFNRDLHRFLGRQDIFLSFDTSVKGYRIKRGVDGAPATHLSEGEKTAIAFIYFMTKLEEHGNNIADSIVVIDDPVSSFDANHVFHAFAFLRTKCAAPRQLFVFTHSFGFFRLVRDWMKGKNKRDADPKSQFYVIQVAGHAPRRSVLLRADDTLIGYNSEYHYLYARLHSYVTAGQLSVDAAFMTANLARKLLESFLSFKFPKKRHDFAQLMEAGVEDPVKRERVYRFVNKYSHALFVPTDESAADIVVGESGDIVTQVFSIIQELDPVHYREMQAVVVEDREG